MSKTKRTFLAVLLVALVAALTVFPFSPARAEQAPAGYDNASSRTYQILTDFVSNHPDRTVGTEGEEKAARYLAQKFYEMGLPAYEHRDVDFAAPEETVAEEYEKYLTVFSGKDQKGDFVNSHNVSAWCKAKTETDNVVIVGAHYDDVYGFALSSDKTRGSHGAYDNGTGVAAMLTLAERFAADPAENVNLLFVAFGSEETGLYGSEAFTRAYASEESMRRDYENTLLMINLDSVGAGDYLYLYTDEVKTAHGKYLEDVAASAGVSLKRPPADKKILLSAGPYGLPYTHVGQMSDHASFYRAGINVAFFFTMNWDTYAKTGAVESTKHEAIMHTSSDTLAKLDEYYAETYVKYMDSAVTVAENSVRRADFVSAMEAARESRPNYSFWTNGLWLVLISLGLVLLIAGFMLLLYFRYRKQAEALPPLDTPSPDGTAPGTGDPFYVFGEGLDGGPNEAPPSSGGDESPFGKEFEEK